MIINRFGYKWSLVFGTVGYVIYSAALYTNNRYGTVWFVYFGSAACGISAGLFWATEGAIMLSYPEPEMRGRYLSCVLHNCRMSFLSKHQRGPGFLNPRRSEMLTYFGPPDTGSVTATAAQFWAAS
jgi:hypothetical protein